MNRISAGGFVLSIIVSWSPPCVKKGISSPSGLPFQLLSFFPRQIISWRHNASPRFCLQLKPCLFGNTATLLAGILVFVHAGGIHTFGNLTGGKFCQSSEDELRLTH